MDAESQLLKDLDAKIADLSQKLIQERVKNLHLKGLVTELADDLSFWRASDNPLLQRAREAVK